MLQHKRGMTARVVLLWALLASAAACSDPDGDTSTGGGSGGSTSGATTAGGGSTNAGSTNGGSTNGGGSSGSGGSSSGSSHGGGQATISELAMLAVGNQWKYTVTGDGLDCPTGSVSTKVESLQPFQGHDAYQVRDFCTPDQLTAFSYDGDTLLQYFPPTEWLEVMASPVEDGTSWTFAPGTTITWHATASITVPAGTFNDCFMRTVSDSPGLQATFCPGVGQVRRVNDGYTAVLESYELH